MLLPVQDWVRMRFAPGRHPAPNTLTRWLNSGQVPGAVRYGERWYIEVDSLKVVLQARPKPAPRAKKRRAAPAPVQPAADLSDPRYAHAARVLAKTPLPRS